MSTVLFVSKAIGPPFHDGTKCLVRDVATRLQRFDAAVMSPENAPPLGGRVLQRPVYTRPSSYTPRRSDNARAFLWLLTHRDAALWHFVFAPNPATSAAGWAARTLRRVPIVQTIASPPRSFEGVERLLFGHVIVAQSEWTRRCVQEASAGKVTPEVIPPCVPALKQPSVEDELRVRRELKVEARAPLFVYPGDFETSTGAETVSAAVSGLIECVPDAIVVFACRAKTPEAPRIEAALRQRLPPAHVRFAGQLSSIHALLTTARVVLFPVEDLHGKVDLPIVLLEAMRLGAPLVACSVGPLAGLQGVRQVPPEQPLQLVRQALELHVDEAARRVAVATQRAAVAEHYSCEVVARRYESLYARFLGAP